MSLVYPVDKVSKLSYTLIGDQLGSTISFHCALSETMSTFV